ncbi:lysozyme inhibitor LprI family protein [Ramlibacter montanisoli]|uniref:Uncharacterized protein n=1 Tax=Ramlibacter montanisoli TaxID=2732512 RepID=A0A849KGC4_9BURK|nr:hypothetical protein [Ramlibacter montanisoli]NNU43965.1 hypothetical protein [Ramlibacter montanisoli]
MRQGTGGTVTASATPAAPAPAPAAPAPAPEAAAPVAPAPAPVAATPAPVTSPVPAPAPARPAEPAAQQAATAPAVPAPAPQARRTSPSFNCAQARSVTEKLICDDEELARADRELGALHQRAREASADPRAFQRNSDAEWAKREATCRDRECLRRWYAERRDQLSAQASTPAPRPAAPVPAASQRPQATTPAPATEQPQPRVRRTPPRTATADASPELAPPPPARPRPLRVPSDIEPDYVPPPPRSSAMGANPGEAPTAEGSAGSTE